MAISASHLMGGAPLWLWLVFHAVVFSLLGVDFLLTRGTLPQRAIALRCYWLTAVWIAVALLFALLVYRTLSPHYALEYLTGYGIEEALSIDNLFVFLLLFRIFGFDAARQRRLLFLGVLGAIVMRAIMIFAGIRLLSAFAWMNYIFGGILLYTAWHLLRKPRVRQSATPGWIGWLSRRLPMTGKEHGERFLIREQGRFRFTPLFLALLAIELTDLIFATDSIPAVLAVSHHPFIVYSSNIFAIVGLRSLYFTLATALDRLHKLRYGLAVILTFVGAKMMLAHVVTVPIGISLAVLGLAVGATSIWSLLSKQASAG